MNNIKHRKISKYPTKYYGNFCAAMGHSVAGIAQTV
jgi:hypothetical protein